MTATPRFRQMRLSDAVVHLEFDRVRRVLEGVHLTHLEFDIAVDKIVVKHAAFLQECAVAFERFERLRSRPPTGGTSLRSGRGKPERSLALWSARWSLVLVAWGPALRLEA